MPSFTRSLEKSLHQALAYASERHQEYATLEHLLCALIDDQDVGAVMRACNVDLDVLRRNLVEYIDTELAHLATGADEDSKPTAGFQRVIERAVIHAQTAGREEVSGVNVLVAIFAERESHAAYFLQEQGMTRDDVVNYIRRGIVNPEMSEIEPVRRPFKFVFISHSREDIDKAASLKSSLEARGIATWWDGNIRPGQVWRQEISRHLEKSSAVLVLWSSNSVSSNAVIEEAATAQTNGKLVQARIDSSALPYGFSETQYVSLQGEGAFEGKRAFHQLISVLRDKLEPPNAKEILRRIELNSPIAAHIVSGRVSVSDRPPGCGRVSSTPTIVYQEYADKQRLLAISKMNFRLKNATCLGAYYRV